MSSEISCNSLPGRRFLFDFITIYWLIAMFCKQKNEKNLQFCFDVLILTPVGIFGFIIDYNLNGYSQHMRSRGTATSTSPPPVRTVLTRLLFLELPLLHPLAACFS
jgi:hypothetical protein